MQKLVTIIFSAIILFSANLSANSTTYYGLIKNSDAYYSELQEEVKKAGGRIAVKLDDILIIKSPYSIILHNDQFQNIKIIQEGDKSSQISLAKNEVLEGLMHWQVKPDYEQVFIDGLPVNQEIYDIDTSVSNLELQHLQSKERDLQFLGDKRLLMCYRNPWVLCDTEQWQTVLKNIDIVKIYIGDINDEVDEEQAICFIKALLDNSIKIAIEMGGLLDWHANKIELAAEYSFEQELNSVRPLIEMIKKIDSTKNIDMIDFDGPIRRMLFPNNKKSNFHTLNTAMDELYEVLALWKEEIPEVEVNLLTNFPNWAWGDTPAFFSIDGEKNGYGQYMDVMNELWLRFKDSEFIFDGLTIDNPYDYAIGTAQTNQPDEIKDVDWIKRVLELEKNARKLSMNVNMIFNTNGGRNDSAYSEQTLALIELYRKAGGRPDGYWIQSWYDKPERWLPEDEDYTMTNLVKSVIPYIGIEDLNLYKTSEYMMGTTTAAVFFVNNENADSMQVPGWNETKQASVLVNIAKNLEWWTDIAYEFGVNKSFIIESYRYDNPAVQVDFDPTEGYTGIASNNSKFQIPIMEKLGYSNSSVIRSMRDFSHDLRKEKETDWAFCAFILEGAKKVVAHAYIHGPYTVLTRGNAEQNFTFTHEVGHLFGAYDEYWVPSHATYINNQSRYGVTNGNFNWRNYPVQPSMMASSFSGGISYYTAVHLGLTDKVNFTRIKTIPEDAIYEVSYFNHNGDSVSSQRYQGTIDFHWGEGMQIQLKAFDKAYSDGYIWSNPVWSVEEGNIIQIKRNQLLPEEIILTYTKTGQASKLSYKYLHTGNALASNEIYSILNYEEKYGFAGTKGISVWDGYERTILDFKSSEDNSTYFRDSRAGAVNIDGDMFFATLSGDVISWENNEQKQYTSDANTPFRIITVLQDGKIWTGVGNENKYKDEVAPAEGLHIFEKNNYSIMNTQNSNLPSDYVSGLSINNDGSLLVSFNAPSEDLSGLYEYNPVQNIWNDWSSFLPNKNITKLKQSNRASIAFHNNGISVIKNGNIDNILPDLPKKTLIYDIAIYNNHIYYATNNGLYILDSNNTVIENYNTDNSLIPSNIIRSITVSDNSEIILGTTNGVVIIGKGTAVNVENINNEHDISFMIIRPNPASDYIEISFSNKGLQPFANSKTIVIYDVLGNEVAQTFLSVVEQASTPVHIQAREHRIDISHLPRGVYFVRIGERVEKFVKR